MTFPAVSVRDQLARVIRHPWAFTLRVVRGFSANQGLLLAGAVAYYALLSLVPLLILSLIILSHFVGQDELLRTVGRYLEWLVPSQSKALLAEASGFLDDQSVIGGILAVIMLFFSSLAFAVLNKALAVIFHQRTSASKRNPLVSFLIPYTYVFAMVVGLLLVTAVASALQALGRDHVVLLEHRFGLGWLTGISLYLLGFVGEVVFISSIYWAMPAGRVPLVPALVGGTAAAALWEIIRHALVWYFATVSQARVVYGSLTTAIVVLLTMEIATTLVLFGAQVIAEFEQFDEG
jgi:membrane protein